MTRESLNVKEAAEPEYLTPEQVGELLQISPDSVYRYFSNVPGVLVLARNRKGYRQHRVLRIPRSAIAHFANAA